MLSPTVKGKVYQVEVVVPDASTEGNVSQVEIVGGGQVKAMFEPQESLLGLIVQYVGATDETYHNGYFYKVVALGTTPETYGWQQTSVQPGGGGGGAVESVNGKTGVVVLTGANIDATVAGITDTVTDHITTLKNDLGDLGDVVSTKAEKVEITLTGESGTLTAEQISALTNADNVVSIVCDGQPFYLSNKDSTLTYRTYINTDCAVSSDVEFKAIYVQLNSEAANYGAWTLEEVSAGGGGLPDQTGHSGEFLTTDGTDALWSDKPLVNKNPTSTNSLFIGGDGGSLSNVGTNSISITSNATYGGWISLGSDTVCIGSKLAGGNQSISIGYGTIGTRAFDVVIGHLSGTRGNSSTGNNICIGARTEVGTISGNTVHAIQLGSTGSTTNNSDSNTFKVGNQNGNFEMMSADGTVPSDRLVHAINKYSTMPTAAAGNVGWIVQFTGTTDATYTHGHLYECVSDGQDPATYSWEEVSMGGGGGLQNTAISPDSLTILGEGTSNTESVNVGRQSEVHDNYSVVYGNYALTSYSEKSVVVGFNAKATDTNNIQQYYNIVCGYASQVRNASNGIAIGNQAFVGANGAMQFGCGGNSEAGTVCFALTTSNDDSGFTNYKLLDSDGTIPAGRHASLPQADGTYVLKLVITDGVPTLSWVAE